MRVGVVVVVVAVSVNMDLCEADEWKSGDSQNGLVTMNVKRAVDYSVPPHILVPSSLSSLSKHH